MSRPLLPAELRIETIVAVVDRREQIPFDLAPLKTTWGALAAGDYSIRGLEHLVAVERKTLTDFISCCASERPRFERELQKLMAYRTRCVICEFSWSDLERGDWRSRLTPQSATGSVLAWIGLGVPFLFAGNRESAQRATARLLFCAARRRYRELRGLLTPANTSTNLSRNAPPPETLAAFSLDRTEADG